MNLTKNQEEFFEKLYLLCKEYDASIGGCGCCGSPSVTFEESGTETLNYLSVCCYGLSVNSEDLFPKEEDIND